MNHHRGEFRVRPAWVRHRRFLILAALSLALLLISGTAPARADGLRISYRDGKWAVSARFTGYSSRAGWCAPSPGWQWNFRCAPGLVARPYYPAYYTGYTTGYTYSTWYGDAFSTHGDFTGYYGLRLNRAPLENTSAPAEPVNAEPMPAPATMDPDAELARVLEEFTSQRPTAITQETGEVEQPAGRPLDPRVEIPESLPYLANLPEVELTTAMPRVR